MMLHWIKTCYFRLFIWTSVYSHILINRCILFQGVYGVPKPWCAKEYARAVYDYSSNPNRSTVLKEIHFVDISDEMLNEIKKAIHTVLYVTDTREFKENRDWHAKYDNTIIDKLKISEQNFSILNGIEEMKSGFLN